MSAEEKRPVLTPERRAGWRREAEHLRNGYGATSGYNRRIFALLDALDAAEASAAEQVTVALDEAIQAIHNERRDRLSQMERNGMKIAELAVREVRQSLTEGEPHTYDQRDNAGPWAHDDGSPCPAYWASAPTASDGEPWWCTTHQQYVHAAAALSEGVGTGAGGGDDPASAEAPAQAHPAGESSRDHRCRQCRKGDHNSHQPRLGGICIGCPCGVEVRS